MLSLGLTSAERAAFEATLRSSHERRIEIQVLTLNGAVLSSLSHMLLDGQVVVDGDADVTRSASLTLADPQGTVSFDSDSPDDAALYLDRAIRIRYCVFVPALDRWIEVPVFTGPITKLSREGGQVSIEAQGKETLAQGAIWTPYTTTKGGERLAIIKDLMQRRAGERFFAFPNDRTKWNAAVTFPRDAIIWTEALRLAGTRGLWYDGRGYLRMRAYSTTPLYTFTTGDGGDVVTRPSVSFTSDEVKNLVQVTGAVPKGAKSNVVAVATAPSTHPLSPARLGRGGVSRVMPDFIDDDSLTTKAAAQKRANQELADRLLSAVEVQFDAMPIPHLEPHDMVTLKTDEFTTDFRLTQFTIPLTPGNPMPIGYIKKLTPNRGRARK